jgi:PBP superfamily domain
MAAVFKSVSDRRAPDGCRLDVQSGLRARKVDCRRLDNLEQDSGLFGYLLPIVKEKTGIVVKVLAQGTGQALDTARRGDADVVFVHAKSAEEKFLAEGFGVKRYPVMYNDFILVGPKDDPAGVKGKEILTALQTTKPRPRLSFRAATGLAPISPN